MSKSCAAPAHAAEHEVRLEVVDVDRELLAERTLRRRLVSEPEQRPRVGRVRRTQGRIERQRLLECFLGRVIVEAVQVRNAHEQVRFCRLARLEDPVDVLLPLLLVAGTKQGHSEDVSEAEIVAEQRFARLQHLHGFLVLGVLQVASRRG